MKESEPCHCLWLIMLRLSMVLVCLFVLVSLSGCYTKTADNNVAEIVVWHGYKPGITRLISESLNGFHKKNRGVHFTVRYVSPSEITVKCLKSIPDGTGPDIVLVPAQFIKPLVDAKVITPVDYWHKKLRSAYAEVGWRLGQRGKHFYGLPLALEGTVFVYNRSLLPKPPTDTQTMLNEITSSSGLSKAGLVLPIKDPYYSLSFYLAQNAKGLEKVGILPTALYYQLLLDIVTLQPNVTPETYINEASVLSNLVSNRAEMGILSTHGLWTLSSSTGDYRAASFPKFIGAGFDTKPACTGGLVAVSAFTEDKELAGRIAEYLTNDAASVNGVQREIGSIPARKRLYNESPFNTPLFKGAFKTLKDGYPVSDSTMLNRLISPLRAGILLTLSKEMSPTGAATEANVRFNVSQ